MNVTLKNNEGIGLNIVEPPKQYGYNGEKIDVTDYRFNFSKYITLDSNEVSGNNQACAYWDGYLFVTKYANNNARLFVFKKGTGEYLATINLNTNVHCNVINFGTEYYNNNNIPVLYASEWDGSKRYFVFNLVKTSETSWSSSLVQTINTSSLTSNIFGAGNSDLCIDPENNYLYSITYKLDSYLSVVSGTPNYYRICKFALPKLSRGSTVTLQDSDVIDSFDTTCFCARQDACFFRGKIYLLAGLPDDSSIAAIDPHTHLAVIDPYRKIVTNDIQLDALNSNKEPEGIFVDNGYIFATFQSDRNLYRFEF